MSFHHEVQARVELARSRACVHAARITVKLAITQPESEDQDIGRMCLSPFPCSLFFALTCSFIPLASKKECSCHFHIILNGTFYVIINDTVNDEKANKTIGSIPLTSAWRVTAALEQMA